MDPSNTFAGMDCAPKKKAAHQCQTCWRSFARKSDLSRHIKIHTGEKPHVCEKCNKGFIQRSALTVHLRTHTGEKPHQCTHQGCDLRFADSSSLARHRRTHTGSRPHKCAHHSCRRSFTRKTTLRKHELHTHQMELRAARPDDIGIMTPPPDASNAAMMRLNTALHMGTMAPPPAVLPTPNVVTNPEMTPAAWSTDLDLTAAPTMSNHFYPGPEWLPAEHDATDISFSHMYNDISEQHSYNYSAAEYQVAHNNPMEFQTPTPCWNQYQYHQQPMNEGQDLCAPRTVEHVAYPCSYTS